MVSRFFVSLQALQRLRAGPLGSYIDRFATLLLEQGYTRWTGKEQIRLVAKFSKWLHQRELRVNDLNEQRILKFLEYRRRRGRIRRGDAATLRMLLEQLRNDGVIRRSPPKVNDSMLSRIAKDFTQYLLQERGVSQATVVEYLPIVKRFLSERFGTRIQLNKLRPPDITTFIIRCAQTISHRYAKLIATVLRSFFHFLHLRGDIINDMAPCVLTVADWRMSTLPKSLEPEQVERLLKSCNQTTPLGQRDYTILLLIARLGLRAGEVVAMTLDDINWEAGELMIRGKDGRRDLLPIPQDVGKALVTYLCHGRQRCSTRQVFVRMTAPHRGFASSVAIYDIVRRALIRADLHPIQKGPHLLRHSLATHMLRKGASLREIGEILRHRRLNTTQIYTKVDLAALRTLAQPWLE